MTIDKKSFPFPLPDAFVAILEEEIAKDKLPPNVEANLTFRDPDYSPERGGFHPVEISVSSRGRIRYIAVFAYVGAPNFAELAKEIDFDVDLGIFQHFGREFPIQKGEELFDLWVGNFVAYYEMGAYQVAVEAG